MLHQARGTLGESSGTSGRTHGTLGEASGTSGGTRGTLGEVPGVLRKCSSTSLYLKFCNNTSWQFNKHTPKTSKRRRLLNVSFFKKWSYKQRYVLVSSLVRQLNVSWQFNCSAIQRLTLRYEHKKSPQITKYLRALKRRLSTLPLCSSTIDVDRLNFSVRNGKRWNPVAITT